MGFMGFITGLYRVYKVSYIGFTGLYTGLRIPRL